MTSPRSEQFWLGMALATVASLLLMLLIALVLCVPWRSNVMVFRLPEKSAAVPVPVIAIPPEAARPL